MGMFAPDIEEEPAQDMDEAKRILSDLAGKKIMPWWAYELIWEAVKAGEGRDGK